MDQLRKDLFEQSKAGKFTDLTIISTSKKGVTQCRYVHKCVINREKLGFHLNFVYDRAEINLSTEALDIIIAYMYLDDISDVYCTVEDCLDALGWVLEVDTKAIELICNKICTFDKIDKSLKGKFYALFKKYPIRLNPYLYNLILHIGVTNDISDGQILIEEMNFVSGKENIAKIGKRILDWVFVSNSKDINKKRVLEKYLTLNPRLEGIDVFQISSLLDSYPNVGLMRILLNTGLIIPYNPIIIYDEPMLGSKSLSISEKEDVKEDKKEDDKEQKEPFLNKAMKEEFIMSAAVPRVYFRTMDINWNENKVFEKMKKYGDIREVTRTNNGYNILFSDNEEMWRVVSLLEQ